MKSEHKEMMKARRRNIKLTLSYDGTNYHGFQRQTKVVAVQNVLEGALFKLFGEIAFVESFYRGYVLNVCLCQIFGIMSITITHCITVPERILQKGKRIR